MGIESLQALSRADVEMDGITYTVRPPRLQDCISAGDIPFPVLDEMAAIEKEREAAKSKGETRSMPMEEIVPNYQLNDTYVRLAVLAINGDPVELTLEDVKDIPATHYDALLGYARRTSTLPKASAPEPSPSSLHPARAVSTDLPANGSASTQARGSTTT